MILATIIMNDTLKNTQQIKTNATTLTKNSLASWGQLPGELKKNNFDGNTENYLQETTKKLTLVTSYQMMAIQAVGTDYGELSQTVGMS